MSLSSSRIARSSAPGKFIEVKIPDDSEVFLRRPFGIHRSSAETFEILYEVIGKGTQCLSSLKAGEYLDIVGPLGNGFNYQPHVTGRARQVLVAGGMGVAPLLFLAEKIVHGPRSTVHRRPLVLIGAKTKKQILCEKDFRKLGCEVKIATDDGSKGFKGYVSELLNELVSTIDHRPATIYACGPRPMLKEISRISKKYKIPAQISLEEHMACGIGACLGCAVK